MCASQTCTGTRTFRVRPPVGPTECLPQQAPPTGRWACAVHTRSLARSHRRPSLAGQEWAPGFKSGWAAAPPHLPCSSHFESPASPLVASSLVRRITARPLPLRGRRRAVGSPARKAANGPAGGQTERTRKDRKALKPLRAAVKRKARVCRKALCGSAQRSEAESCPWGADGLVSCSGTGGGAGGDSHFPSRYCQPRPSREGRSGLEEERLRVQGDRGVGGDCEDHRDDSQSVSTAVPTRTRLGRGSRERDSGQGTTPDAKRNSEFIRIYGPEEEEGAPGASEVKTGPSTPMGGGRAPAGLRGNTGFRVQLR